MSTSKLDTSGTFTTNSTKSNPTGLTLTTREACIRKNGIEFLSAVPFPTWREMTVDLHSPGSTEILKCTGIIVACDGNSKMGYSVSMVFMNLSPLSQEKLCTMASSSLA